MISAKRQKLLLLGTIFVYFLIGIEIIIMISPFALYFYSVYGPILNFLSASPLTSWTTEFFLPHMVFLDDPVILAISYLQILLAIGLILFFSAAIPLYYGRFTKKGVVASSFYSKIRHPQYLFLAISGLGLLIYWPRFIILISYVTMLYVYYILARNEEWRMKEESLGEYEKYMDGKPMFFPGSPGKKIFAALFGWIKPKWLGILASYILTLALAIFLAVGIRSYTVQQLPISLANEMALVSVFKRPSEEIINLHAKTLDSDLVQHVLKDDQSINLAYIMPGDFFLTALVTDKDRRFSDEIIERFPEVLEWHQHKFSGGLGKFFRIFYNFVSMLGTVETDYDIERIIFVSVTNNKGESVSTDNIFDLGLKRRPVLLVDVDADSQKIVSIVKTSDNHKWGNMPMPTF